MGAEKAGIEQNEGIKKRPESFRESGDESPLRGNSGNDCFLKSLPLNEEGEEKR